MPKGHEAEYRHIKQSEMARGKSDKEATAIAFATIYKRIHASNPQPKVKRV